MNEKISWFQRLQQGLSRSAQKISTGITDLVVKKKLDEESLLQLEELLLSADLGLPAVSNIIKELRRDRFGKDITEIELKQALSAKLSQWLKPVERPLQWPEQAKPAVILFAGVNGAGKTTTIGKLAAKLRASGKSVWLAAGDTFRAAAVEQLKVWGERTGCHVVSAASGADAAGLAYTALAQAKAAGVDVLLLDTAGRLQNRAELMAELGKIVKVLKKLDEAAPHVSVLTLDATVGQNAHSQVKLFAEVIPLSGLILTKLDGTAKGGVLVALAESFKLPVFYIGVGEALEDLRDFAADDFAKALVGLANEK